MSFAGQINKTDNEQKNIIKSFAINIKDRSGLN